MSAAGTEEQFELPHLSEDVLVSLLQYLPLRERLGCALVCKAWAAAAALTTADLEAELGSCIRWEHVQEWLHQHAAQVSSIRFNHHGQHSQVLQLPCSRLAKLQKLFVNSMTIRLQELPGGPSIELTDEDCSTFSTSCAVSSAAEPAAQADSNPADRIGSAAAAGSGACCILPELQHLEIFSCSIALDHLLQLSRATSLTRLDIYNSTVTQDTSCSAPATEEQLTAAIWTVLQGLTSLSDLTIALMGPMSRLALCPISNMQGLQRLQLNISTDTDHTDSFLASLPASLTAVELKDMCVTPCAAVAAQLSRLTNLQQLRLKDLDFDPLLLCQWSGLQLLVLDAVYLPAPAVQVNARFSDDSSSSSSSTRLQLWAGDDFNRGAQALFSALRQLPQLQHLELSRIQLDEVIDTQQLSALTASSELTSLTLQARFSMPLPQGALQYVLPQGLQHTQLRVLRLQGGDGVSPQQCLDASDIARIASCCPGLTELSLKGVVSVGVSLAPLLKLQASLKSLSVAGAAFGDAAAMLVAQMTGLQSLEWCDSAALTDSGLVRLSALRGLTWLYVKSCKRLSPAILPPDTWYSASNLLLEPTAEAVAPDVWRQLLQLCEAASQQGQPAKPEHA